MPLRIQLLFIYLTSFYEWTIKLTLRERIKNAALLNTIFMLLQKKKKLVRYTTKPKGQRLGTFLSHTHSHENRVRFG